MHPAVKFSVFFHFYCCAVHYGPVQCLNHCGIQKQDTFFTLLTCKAQVSHPTSELNASSSLVSSQFPSGRALTNDAKDAFKILRLHVSIKPCKEINLLIFDYKNFTHKITLKPLQPSCIICNEKYKVNCLWIFFEICLHKLL